MENPNGPETPSPERSAERPPVLDLANGLAIFMLVFLVFVVAQVVAMLAHVRSVHPDLATASWRDVMNSDQWAGLATNGDAMAIVSLASGAAGLALLLLLGWIWKRDRLVALFGLKLPAFKPFLAWSGFFVGVFVVLEVIAQFLPESEVMDNILGTITNYPLFFLGSCLMPALFEEFLFRGLLLGSLRQTLDKNMAVAITAGLFTLMHMYYEWYLLLFSLLPLAVFLGYARTNSGSIWTGVFLHFMNNAASVALPLLFRSPS
jgi:membrane protease YdiL (CAAX protease family)